MSGHRRARHQGEGGPQALATLALLAALIAGTVGSHAQQAPRVGVLVAPTMLIEPAVESALPIQVGPAGAIPRNSFVRIRGLPPAANLSEGHIISPGIWAVPISSLAGLKLTSPAGAPERSDISIALVGLDGTILAEARASLVFMARAKLMQGQVPPPEPQPSPSIASLGPPPGLPTNPSPPAMRPERLQPSAIVVPVLPATPAPQRVTPLEAARHFERGERLLADGNLIQARLFFTRAAGLGHADAAVSLARTYDPIELVRMNAQGVQPDVALARRWYERAIELGASDASDRLRRLGAR